MVSTLEIFDGIVDEALFSNLAEAAEAEMAAVLKALDLFVDGLPPDYLNTHIPKALPPHVEEEGETVLNPLLSDHRAFAPLYLALAKFFYETVAPVSLRPFPEMTLRSDPAALFGVGLVAVQDYNPSDDPDDAREESLGLFAGCVALAVDTCLRQPVTLAVAYLLAVAGSEPTKVGSAKMGG